MKRLTTLLLLLSLLSVWMTGATQAGEAPPAPRTLKSIKIESTAKLVRIRLDLEGNQFMPLGKVSYEGKQILLQIRNATISDSRKTLKADSDDSLVSQVTAKIVQKDVRVSILLKSPASGVMEHVVFEPGKNDSLIELRKPEYYQPTAASPAAPVELNEIFGTPKNPPPLGADPVPVPNAAATTPTPPPPLPATPHPAPPAPSPEPTPSIGESLADLTNLYWMAGLIFLLALLLFLFVRSRRLRLAGFDEPLKILSTKNLGGHQRLLVVEVDGKRLLLASGGKDLRLITELDRTISPEDQMKQALAAGRVKVLKGSGPAGGLSPTRQAKSPTYFSEPEEETPPPPPKSTPSATGEGGGVDTQSLLEYLKSMRQGGK